MNVVRVLHVVTKMDAAGIETLLMNIYRNIDKKKIQFDFLTHRMEEGFYDKEILKLGGKIYRIPSINPFHHKKYLNALDKFFQSHQEYKIVHSHINAFSMYILRAAKNAGIPIRIAHSHIANPPLDLKTPFRIYTKSKLKKYSTHNFACSVDAGKWLFGSEAISKDNFKVVNNSIDAPKYIYDTNMEKRIRRQLGLNGKFVIGHIGRFSKQKNHAFLIDIFNDVKKLKPDSVLMLVGEGELKEKIEKKVIDLGIEDSVIFTGVRSDVNNLLQAMDIFVFPSIYEGLGIVAIEAQAAGLRCVVSEAVPEEAFITDLIEKIPLNKGAKTWADYIIKYANYNKKNTLEDIQKAKFDINEEVKNLQDFYLYCAVN